MSTLLHFLDNVITDCAAQPIYGCSAPLSGRREDNPSYIPDRWTAQLNRLGLTGARVEKLMEGMVSQALKELTAIYSTRYAAIQHKKAQDE
jgi:hypothetical protein